MELHGVGQSTVYGWFCVAGTAAPARDSAGRVGDKGGTPGATTCARNRTLVACVRSIDDRSELELELVNGGTRRMKG
jgi:hypothetical protein